MRKTQTKAELVAAHARSAAAKDAYIRQLQGELVSESDRRAAAESKLDLYERLDHVIAARIRARLAADKKLVQLGWTFEVMGKDERGYAIERAVCASEDDAAAQVLDELNTAVSELNDALDREVADLENALAVAETEHADEREMFLRALGLAERQWHNVSWKWRY